MPPGAAGRARACSLALKAVVLLTGIVSFVLGFRQMGGGSSAYFLYYTNLSGAWATLLSAALLVLETSTARAGAQLRLPPWLHALRFSLVSGVLLTFAGFSLLLVPKVPLSYLSSPANLLAHNLLPLLAALDFVLFPHGDAPRRPAAQGLVMPFLYLLFAGGLMLSGVSFAGSPAPYFFLNVRENGWLGAGDGKLGVIWWMLLIAALSLLLSWLLLGFRRLAARRFQSQ